MIHVYFAIEAMDIGLSHKMENTAKWISMELHVSDNHSSFICVYRWMEACLEEELPPTTELEEGLRNGVYLGKLGKFFAPTMVSEKKIYDRDQSRYRVRNNPAFITCALSEKSHI